MLVSAFIDGVMFSSRLETLGPVDGTSWRGELTGPLCAGAT